MEAGKAYLRKADANGVSVYSHLTTVLASLLETQPANALNAFESVSLACKAKSYKPGMVSTGVAPPELPDHGAWQQAGEDDRPVPPPHPRSALRCASFAAAPPSARSSVRGVLIPEISVAPVRNGGAWRSIERKPRRRLDGIILLPQYRTVVEC